MVEEDVWVGGVRDDLGGLAQQGGLGDKVDVLLPIGGCAGIANQKRDGGRVDRGAELSELLADGQFVGRDAVDAQGEDCADDVLMGGLEEVGGLEVGRANVPSSRSVFGS